MRVGEKGDRLISLSGNEEEVVDELSELDRAAAPLQQQPDASGARAQAVAFENTDGRAARDNGETTTLVNRFRGICRQHESDPAGAVVRSGAVRHRRRNRRLCRRARLHAGVAALLLVQQLNPPHL